MKENKVLMDKFKDYEIYYDKDKERFVADKPKLDIHFEARSLWEIKGSITESRIEEVNKEHYIKSGYFNKSIAKIRLLTMNKDLKRCKYKVLDDTGESYSINQIKEDQEILKFFKITEANTSIFSEVRKLEKDIEELESKQKELVRKLR